MNFDMIKLKQNKSGLYGIQTIIISSSMLLSKTYTNICQLYIVSTESQSNLTEVGIFRQQFSSISQLIRTKKYLTKYLHDNSLIKMFFIR